MTPAATIEFERETPYVQYIYCQVRKDRFGLHGSTDRVAGSGNRGKGCRRVPGDARRCATRNDPGLPSTESGNTSRARLADWQERSERKVMHELMSLAEINATFESEWVLLENPETTESLEVKAGKVLWHSKDRDELYRKARELG